ncbi:MAG: DUF222 domain-containing protein [Candidatus Nanopelagicales bacterium]
MATRAVLEYVGGGIPAAVGAARPEWDAGLDFGPDALWSAESADAVDAAEADALAALFDAGEPWDACADDPEPAALTGARVAEGRGAPDAVGAGAVDGASAGPVPLGLAGWVRPEWWSAVLDRRVRALLVMPVGPSLAQALEHIGALERCGVDHRDADPCVEAVERLPVPGSAAGFACPCQLLVAAAWEAVMGWASVRSAGAVCAAVGGSEVGAVPEGFARAGVVDQARVELAAVLGISPAAAVGRIAAARALIGCRELAAAAAEGLVFSSGLSAVLFEVRSLSKGARRAVLGALAGRVRARRGAGRGAWTPPQLRRRVRALVLSLAAEEAAQARRRSRAGRRVSVTPDSGGMAWLSALVADTDAQRIRNRLTSAAAAARADHPGGADRPSMDQLRADLLVAALLGLQPADGPDHDAGGLDSGQSAAGDDRSPVAGTGPLPVGSRPELSVVVDLPTLLHLADHAGDVAGLGPVPADVARWLAADGRWRLLITSAASGLVVATSPRTYAPSAALARLIRAREPSCRMPGCTRAAVDSDLDHTQAWPAAPGSTPANLGPLCRPHHNLKTHHGYQLHNHQEDPGGGGCGGAPRELNRPAPGWTWTFPSGLTHTDHPDPPLPGP